MMSDVARVVRSIVASGKRALDGLPARDQSLGDLQRTWNLNLPSQICLCCKNIHHHLGTENMDQILIFDIIHIEGQKKKVMT